MSAGWQKNFSQDGKVCHFSVLTGEIVERDRSVERSLYQRDYGTYWDADGTPKRSVDELFSETEHKVIKPLRLLSYENVGEIEKRRIIDLFGLHHARSTAMRRRLQQTIDGFIEDATDELMASAKIVELAIQRDVVEGHVEDFLEREGANKTTEVGSLPRIRDDAVQFLSRLNVQVIESPESFPGFVLGDVPVVNAKLSEQRFGIRDRVKLDQSDFIGGPLSRHQAVVFSSLPAAHFVLSKPDVIASFNAQTLFAATEVVVCHPDDAEAIRVLWANREAFRTTGPLIH